MASEEEWVPPCLDWRPFSRHVRGAVKGARYLACVFTLFWCYAVFWEIYTFNRDIVKAKDDCPTVGFDDGGAMDRMDVKWGVSSHNEPFRYDLHRYRIGLNEEQEDEFDRHEKMIPILYIPSTDKSFTQSFVAKILKTRTEGTSIRFVWYGIDFRGEKAAVDGVALDVQLQFVTMAVNVITSWHPDQRIVLIGHQFGGVLAAAYTAGFYFPHIEHVNPGLALNRTHLADLVILQAAPVAKPGIMMDWEMWAFYKEWQRLFDENVRYSRAGIISFNGGVKDFQIHHSWTKIRGATHIPAYYIDGVPDSGIRDNRMYKAVPFVDHIIDLLIFYAQHNKHERGATIVRRFYEQIDAKRAALLPDGWNNSRVAGEQYLVTGYRSEFMMNRKLWMRIKLERDEYLQMRIYSQCLTHATLVRSLKYIRRKDVMIDGEYFEFGVYDSHPFEDIRLLLESPGDCHVIIETTPWWKMFGHRLYRGYYGDEHSAYVGMLICATWLVLLEGQKLGARTDQVVDIMVVITGGGVAQMFSQVIGTRMEGLIFGFMCTLIVYFAVGSFFATILVYGKRCLDRYYFTAFIEQWFVWLALANLGISLCSASVGLGLFVLLFAAASRPFHVLVFLFPLSPLFSKWRWATHLGVKWRGLGLWERFPIAFGQLLLCCALAAWARHEDIRLPRWAAHLPAYFFFALLACISYWPLETHIGLCLFVLIIADRAVKHTPKQMFKRQVDWPMLEKEQYAYLEILNT